MIKFALKCSAGHGFESWFQSGAAYEALSARQMLSCPVCGSATVEKALMAPAVSVPARPAQAGPDHAAPDGPALEPALRERAPLGRMAPDMAARIAALRAEIEARSDYVGPRFVEEARAMYLGEIPDRPIHGEADPVEAKALINEGVPILPLPFIPTRKTN
ncbi:MAG: DUF1178 family protein [Roseinatronobacter sp.]